MVTCLVCGKKYEAGECPRCRFPDVQVPGMEREKARIYLKSMIDDYKKTFLENIRVEVVSYRWKDQDGTIVLDRKTGMKLGTGTKLLQGEVWLPDQFARIPDEKTVPVKVRVTAGDENFEKTIRVPNLLKPELQQLGAKMDEDFRLTLLLRSETQQAVKSEPVSLF